VNPTRRDVLQLSSAAALGGLAGGARSAEALQRAPEPALPPAIAALQPMTQGMEPISLDERRARVRRAQELMAQEKLDALMVAPGTSLEYFSGVRWSGGERLLAMVLTREGDPGWVAPAFEKARAQELIPFGEVRAWEEHESPYALVASILHDRKAAAGTVGVEEATAYAFSDGIARALPAARMTSGTPVTAGCRMIKDAHELALMRRAGEITVRAWRAVFASLSEGMTQSQVGELCSAALDRQGLRGGALVLFGPDAAFPHGTSNPKPLRAGQVVLIDGGARLFGYSSDITRTAVFGAAPTDRQRQVWDLVRKAQEAAFHAARPGVEAQSVDAAARRVIEEGGFGPGYKYFTHRVGHGIGMDGHEWTYLVKGNTTKLRPGMCFSDEPGIYIPGEMGIRHEDVMTITEAGADVLEKWSGTPEEPAVA
jgi:Xaa-Pro aminopeptidase